jgi:methyl-accepting chemotaxis protein
MAETSSSERQSPSASASTSGGQRTDKPRRRLAVTTWLMALVAALLCGLPTAWLQREQARQAALVIVENQAKLGSQAVAHHFALRRESRASAFSSVAARPRSLEGGRPAWDQLAQEARGAGADLAAIVDEGGALLAQDGVGAVALAEAAVRSSLTPSGSLIAVGGQLVESFRIPVTVDAKPGFLIAGCRILPESLRQDAEPLGIGVAIALEGAFVTNLPADALSSGRWGDDPQETLHNLSVRYHLRATPLPQGRLLVAVPLSMVQNWSNEQFQNALLLIGLLCSSVLLLAAVVQIWVISPLHRLSDAAVRVSQGSLNRGRGMLKQFLDRNDEFAAISRGLDVALHRLLTLLGTSNRLLDDIDSTIATIERVGSSLAGAASVQEDRSKDVLTAVAPIGRAIDRLTRQMVEVRNAVVQISLAWSTADQSQAQVLSAARRADTLLQNPEVAEARSYRTATVAQQLQLITQTLTEEREALNRIKDQIATLRSTVDGAMDSVGFDDSTGAGISRSMQDISRLARQQSSEAESLKNAVEHLRKDSEKLSLLIAAIQSRASEDLATTSGTWNIGSRSRSTGDRASRSSTAVSPAAASRSAAGASSQAIRPLGLGSQPSPKSSGQNASASGERRISAPGSTHSPRATVSGSSPSLRPVGSGSSPGLRPVTNSSQSLRPISMIEGGSGKARATEMASSDGKRGSDPRGPFSGMKGGRSPSDPKGGE